MSRTSAEISASSFARSTRNLPVELSGTAAPAWMNRLSWTAAPRPCASAVPKRMLRNSPAKYDSSTLSLIAAGSSPLSIMKSTLYTPITSALASSSGL